MARSDGPPNGLDHPPQNGHRAKHVAIALFIATTFGIMAILSFPLSGVRGPLKLPRPLQAALSPFERLIRPIVPWLVRPATPRPPLTTVALAPQPRRFVTPKGPGGTRGPPPQPPGQPPPGQGPPSPRAGPPPQRPATREWTVLFLAARIREWTVLIHRTTKPSEEQIKLIREQMTTIRSLRFVCLPDHACAKLLKRAASLFRRLEARANHGHDRGQGNKKHRHHKDSTIRSGGHERDHASRPHDHARNKHGKHKGHAGKHGTHRSHHVHGKHKGHAGKHGTHRSHHKHGKHHDKGHRGDRHLSVG